MINLQSVDDLNKIYSDIVCWKKNLFLLPSGKAIKDFVVEVSRLLQALVVMQVLVLQTLHVRSKGKEH